MNVHCRVCKKFLFVDPNGIEVIDAICFHCDNSQEATLPIDPDISVYAVPVTITLKAEVYVLGRSVVDARIEANKLDLEDIFYTDEESCYIDESARAKLLDADARMVDPTSRDGEPKPLKEADYKPTEHPDYNPGDHDEVDDDESEGRPEGLRS